MRLLGRRRPASPPPTSVPFASKPKLAAVRLLLCLCLWAGAGRGLAAERLPALGGDPAASSVSGLSSGASMAVQFHVAFSASLVGVGAVAGGPYACAEGNPFLALNRCMATSLGAPDPRRLLGIAAAAATFGGIDPLSNLARARVYVFGGGRDKVVTPPVVDALVRFYRLAGVPEANMLVERGIPAGHAFITEGPAAPCAATRAPFINDCDYDQAGTLLRHIYGALEPPSASPREALATFDQAEFLPRPRVHGLDDTGLVYVPAACRSGAGCRVHVAFHGCEQGREAIGDRYATRTGYNRWADDNRLVVLYPQAVRTLGNPNGCWDWFAYDDPAYHTKSGRQMAAVKRMLDRLLQPTAR